MIKSGIESHFGKTFDGENGRKFVMSANIDVQVVGNESEAISKGVDNIAELGYNKLLESDGSSGGLAQAFRIEGESFDRMVATIDQNFEPTLGSLTGSRFEDTFGHEFGSHLLNGGHDLLMKTVYSMGHLVSDRK